MKKQVHIRSHRARCGRGGFHGPDCHVVVTVAPLDAVVPYQLRADVLAKRGITLRYFGEGYRDHAGPRSRLGRALAAAEAFALQEAKCVNR